MISKRDYEQCRDKAISYFNKASIVITDEEATRIEVADFGLNDVENVGLEILTYVNTDRVCAKEMVLFPRQTCPEHTHCDGIDDRGIRYSGKEETFRCRYGTVYLYVAGEPTSGIKATKPNTVTTVCHEIVLTRGLQYTMMPNTLHWFQAGDDGAVISEFSTKSRDESDVFTDKKIVRIPEIAE